MTKLMPAAKAAFERELTENVGFLAEKCWESNLDHHVRKINSLLEAAGCMGVLDKITLLSEREMIALVNDLRPLRTLKMTAEAYEHIVQILVAQGVPPLTFASKALEIQRDNS